jgi:hypothetical protein
VEIVVAVDIVSVTVVVEVSPLDATSCDTTSVVTTSVPDVTTASAAEVAVVVFIVLPSTGVVGVETLSVFVSVVFCIA